MAEDSDISIHLSHPFLPVVHFPSYPGGMQVQTDMLTVCP